MSLKALSDPDFNTYLHQNTQTLIEIKQRDNCIEGVIKTIALPALVLAGTLLATLYLAINCPNSGLTHSVTMGAYSIGGIICGSVALTYLIGRGLFKTCKSKEILQRESSLELLTQLEGAAQEEVPLQDGHYVTKKQITDKKTALQGELQKLHSAGEKNWESYKHVAQCILTPIVLALLTTLATLFAAEYLPLTSLTSTATAGVITGIVLTGLTATIFHPLLKTAEDKERKTIASYLVPIALTIATVVGMIFLSEYLPQNVLSSTFYEGTCSVVGILASATIIASLIHVINRHVHGESKYEIETIQAVSVYIWLGPLVIVLGGIVFGSLCVNEWASAALQPYLFSAVIIGGILLALTHVAYTCYSMD